MQKQNTKSSIFWSWIGKFSVLVGATWVVLQMFQFFFAEDIKVDAFGTFSLYGIPDTIRTAINQFESSLPNPTALRVKELKRRMQAARNEVQDGSEEPLQLEVAEAILKHFNTHYPKHLIQVLKVLQTTLSFEVHNNGNKKVASLNLELPFQGFYRMSRTELSNDLIGSFDRQIHIGSL